MMVQNPFFMFEKLSDKWDSIGTFIVGGSDGVVLHGCEIIWEMENEYKYKSIQTIGSIPRLVTS